MKTKTLLSFIILISGLALTCCSPYTLVSSEVYNGANLASFKTFRIVVPDDTNKLPPTMQEITYYNIAQAIRTQMVDRGFVENPTSPLLINIGLTVRPFWSQITSLIMAPVRSPDAIPILYILVNITGPHILQMHRL